MASLASAQSISQMKQLFQTEILCSKKSDKFENLTQYDWENKSSRAHNELFGLFAQGLHEKKLIQKLLNEDKKNK